MAAISFIMSLFVLASSSCCFLRSSSSSLSIKSLLAKPPNGLALARLAYSNPFLRKVRKPINLDYI